MAQKRELNFPCRYAASLMQGLCWYKRPVRDRGVSAEQVKILYQHTRFRVQRDIVDHTENRRSGGFIAVMLIKSFFISITTMLKR